MDAPFGAKINTALCITKPVTYYLPFFNEYLKEVEEIIKPEKLVATMYRKNEYSASGISIEAGIQAVKLFAEKFDAYNKYSYYVGTLKINGKKSHYDNIDKYFSTIHDRLEKSLLREYEIYKNQLKGIGQFHGLAYRSIHFSVRKSGYYKGRIIVLFDIFGEPVDLF